MRIGRPSDERPEGNAHERGSRSGDVEEFGAIEQSGNEAALDALVMGSLVGVLFMMKKSVSESDALRVIASTAGIVWAEDFQLAVPARGTVQ